MLSLLRGNDCKFLSMRYGKFFWAIIVESGWGISYSMIGLGSGEVLVLRLIIIANV